jgi:hypothetical protein
MSTAVQIGSILIEEGPRMKQLLGLESEPYSGNWSLVSVPDGLDLDQKIRASGWNYFFMADEVTAVFLGPLGPQKIQNALKRILGKVVPKHFNALEVTKVVAKHFLGVPYTVVSAHSRHIQQSCYLDDTEARLVSQHNAAWARG